MFRVLSLSLGMFSLLCFLLFSPIQIRVDRRRCGKDREGIVLSECLIPRKRSARRREEDVHRGVPPRRGRVLSVECERESVRERARGVCVCEGMAGEDAAVWGEGGSIRFRVQLLARDRRRVQLHERPVARAQRVVRLHARAEGEGERDAGGSLARVALAGGRERRAARIRLQRARHPHTRRRSDERESRAKNGQSTKAKGPKAGCNIPGSAVCLIEGDTLGLLYIR